MASITRGLVWANDQSVIWKFILYYEPFICIYEVIISYLLSICHELSVSISAEKDPYTASLAMTTCRHPGRNRLHHFSELSFKATGNDTQNVVCGVWSITSFSTATFQEVNHTSMTHCMKYSNLFHLLNWSLPHRHKWHWKIYITILPSPNIVILPLQQHVPHTFKWQSNSK